MRELRKREREAERKSERKRKRDAKKSELGAYVRGDMRHTGKRRREKILFGLFLGGVRQNRSTSKSRGPRNVSRRIG